MGLYVFNWPISVLGDWKDIPIAYVIVIIKPEVSTFPIVIIFFRGCVPEMFLHHILSLIAYTFRENREFVFIIIVQFIMSVKTFWLADRIRLFVHCTISLSLLCKLIWRHWTYKMLVRYILSSVSKIKHILSVIHYTICGAVCFQFTHFSFYDWGNMYTYYHH